MMSGADNPPMLQVILKLYFTTVHLIILQQIVEPPFLLRQALRRAFDHHPILSSAY